MKQALYFVAEQNDPWKIQNRLMLWISSGDRMAGRVAVFTNDLETDDTRAKVTLSFIDSSQCTRYGEGAQAF